MRDFRAEVAHAFEYRQRMMHIGLRPKQCLIGFFQRRKRLIGKTSALQADFIEIDRFERVSCRCDVGRNIFRHPPSTAETDAVVEAYLAIPDAAVRRRLLYLLIRMAEVSARRSMRDRKEPRLPS